MEATAGAGASAGGAGLSGGMGGSAEATAGAYGAYFSNTTDIRIHDLNVENALALATANGGAGGAGGEPDPDGVSGIGGEGGSAAANFRTYAVFADFDESFDGEQANIHIDGVSAQSFGQPFFNAESFGGQGGAQGGRGGDASIETGAGGR